MGTKPRTLHCQQSQGHYTANHLGENGKRMKKSRKKTQWSTLKGRERAIVGTGSKSTLGKFLRDRWNIYGPSWACRYHLKLNWTEENRGTGLKRTEVLLSCCSSRCPYPKPKEVHSASQPCCQRSTRRDSKSLVGYIPSTGDTALLLSHFSGILWCLCWFNIPKTLPTMPLPASNVRISLGN